ncbi:MAG: gliding motility-associated C-terminal domain-containing protein [Bacteroidota bacterium]
MVSGLYEATVTDAANCVLTIQETVNEPAILAVVITPTDLLCSQDNSGEIDAVASGGTPVYDYAWTGPNGFTGNGPNLVGLEAGTYSLTLIDDNNCVLSEDVVINEPDELSLSFTESPISCNGDSDGEIDLTVSGGTAPFDFDWTGPGGFTSTNEDITGLSVGVYEVTVEDDNGCIEVQSYDLTEPLPIELSAVIIDPNCTGDVTGEIDLTITNGTAPYDVAWTGPNGFMSIDEDISNLEAGAYDVAVTDAGGCVETNQYTVQEPTGLTATFDQTDVSCFEGSDGSILVSPNGGVPPYDFDWTGPNGFISSSQNLSNLVAGEYTLVFSDDNGCNQTFDLTITEPTNIDVVEAITDVSCFSGSDGEITLAVSGATPDYDFSWTGPGGFNSANQDISGLEEGTYDLEITDANGCIFNFSYTIEEPDPIVLIAFTNQVLCAGDFTGAINLTVTGGNAPFDFSWTGPNGFISSDEDISGLEAGDYTIDIEDALGCTINATYEIEEQIDIVLNVSSTDITCFGEDDGSIEMTVSGGNEPYDISWIGPNGFSSADEDLANLEPGTYDVVVTDANNCSEIGQVDILEPFEIVLDIVSTNIDCFGQNDGTIALTATGGTGSITVSWTGPNGFTSGDLNLNNLEPGEYTVLAEDDNGCSATDAVTITEGSELIVSVESFDSNCLQADGLAVATASGGTGILTYTWTDEDGIEVAVNDSLIDVESGTYEVNVEDELGCSATALAEISDNNGTLTGTITSPSCAGGSNGTITTQLVGGTAPFDYEWIDENGPFSNDENLTNLSAGTYILSIEDAVGCVFTETFEVIDPDEITVDVVTTQISCVGADGTIDLTIQNAQDPFDVNWTGPIGFSATGTTLANLEGGEYEYSFTDANGCFESGTVEIQAADPISILEIVENILCTGDDNGSIDVEISGGIAPLDITWTGPNGFNSADEDLFDLEPGEYTLAVTDQALCTEQITIEIIEPAQLEVEVVVTEPDCNLSNGSLEAVITGGTISADYQVEWTDELGDLVSNLALVENLDPGSYSITVTDDNGCQVMQDVALSNPGGDVVPTVTPETCADQMNGSIDLEINDVAEPFTVTWTGPDGFTSNDEDISGLSGGTYTYVIEAADGCVFSESLEVLSPDGLGVTSSITNTCFGVSEGEIELEILGGEEPYTITWTGPNGFSSDQPIIADLAAGDYTVSIVDNIGCDFDSTYRLTESPEIIAVLTSQAVACFGESNGSVDLELSGGVSPFSVSWIGPADFESGDEDISNLAPGQYEVTITDANSCELTETTQIDEPDEIDVIEIVTASGCADEPNSGSITLEVTGGEPGGYLFDWLGPNDFTASGVESIENLDPGTYTYTVTDQANCFISNSIDINEVTPIEASINSSNPNCFGESSGSAEVIVSGGMSPYQISWAGPNGFAADTPIIESLEAGDYSIVITDDVGCDLSDQITLTQPDSLTLELSSATATCENTGDGSIEATVSGGTEDYSFEWQGPDGFTSSELNISALLPGEYNLTLSDANGCVVQDTADVEVLFELEVFAGPDTALCPSDLPVTLFGSVAGGDQFTWRVDTTIVSDSSIVIIDDSFESLTEIILTGSNGFCQETDSLVVEILESPDVEAGDDLQVFTEERFTLGGSPTSTDDVEFAWSPNPMSVFDTTQANPVGFLTESTLFSLVVTDQNGCTSSDSAFVEVLPDVEVNSGFTPNGDGVNDVWIIENIELFPNMEVHVYNRWGVEVFESRSYNANVAWDGKYEGAILPSGTYYYTLELNDPRFPDPITGPLTLHR